MRKAALILAYVAVFFAMGLFTGPVQVAAGALAAFLFALAFLRWASGSAVTVILVVVLLTIVFPIAGVLFIGLPVYESWVETLKVAVHSSRENGVLAGAEWLVPLVSGCIGLAVASRLRTKVLLERGAQ
jgi:hypothetical protein